MSEREHVEDDYHFLFMFSGFEKLVYQQTRISAMTSCNGLLVQTNKIGERSSL